MNAEMDDFYWRKVIKRIGGTENGAVHFIPLTKFTHASLGAIAGGRFCVEIELHLVCLHLFIFRLVWGHFGYF